MKVLYLTEWYPHRYDAMSGLFVRKHAEAVAGQGGDVCVLYLYNDKSIGKTEIVSTTTNGVKEIYVYYPGSYLKALVCGWKRTKEQWGMPDVCQLNVITKNALLPIWLRLKHHVPYVIVEHWTGYLPISMQYKGFLHKRLTELAVRLSAAVLPVSADLKKAMINCGLRHSNYQVINNVVDDFFYGRERKLSSQKKRILHISCFDEEHKNVCGILRTIKKIAKKRYDFEIIIVGTGVDFSKVYKYATEHLHLRKSLVRWIGEQTPAQVADWFRQSDFFLMFSNYENAPVVISEALAMGIPVVSSNVGGIPEMVNRDCGILVDAADDKALANAILYMLDHCQDYDSETIKKQGERYTYRSVGQTLMHIYEDIRENK